MLSEGRVERPRCLGGWLAVTQGPSRNTGGAAIGHAEVTHESVPCQSAGRLASIVGAGGGSRLPHCLHATAWCGSETLRRLPAGQATSALLTVTQEPSRTIAAQRSALPMLHTNRLFAEARYARQKSLVQEAGTACPIVCTPPHAAGASSSRGCRKQPGCPLMGRLVHSGCNCCHRALAVGRDESRPTNGSGPEGPTPEVGTRRSPIFPDGSKLPPAARRLSGRDESRPGAQESRSKLGRCGM